MRVFIFICFVFFVSDALAQTAAIPSNELILRIHQSSVSREQPAFVPLLKSIDGVEFVDFCTNLQVVLLRVDRRKHQSNSEIYKVLTNNQYVFEEKIGAGISKVLLNCKH